MDTGNSPDIITGNSTTPTPILASESEPTAAPSVPVPAPSELASITVADVLSLLQTDCSDLRSKGLSVAILARENRLFLAVTYPDHELGFENGSITLDGKAV